MINFLLCCVIFSVNITPQNAFLEHYTILPPLGQIKSIATSPRYVLAISDNYLLILDKQKLTLEQTIHFDKRIDLIGYDRQYDDVWISSTGSIIRLTIASYNTREYTFFENIQRFGIGLDYLYLDAERKYSLNKRTGETQVIYSFPENLQWYEKTSESDIRNYPFLTPYYYYDNPEESQSPFFQYEVTSIYDDGMGLYVGTAGYGILKYNKVSWQKERIVYGPLDTSIRKVQKHDDQIYLISPSGISYYTSGKSGWKYLRLFHDVVDFIWTDNGIILSIENRISRPSGAMMFTISDFETDVICLNSDEKYIFIGTNCGLFKLIKGSKEPIQFGPDQYSVYTVYPTSEEIYVGGEIGFYKYNRKEKIWSKLINRGIKNIVEIKNELYLLSVDNQLIRYRNVHGDSSVSDTSWTDLPYFNIYDIATDNEVLYCASYAGIYYYEPSTKFYKLIFGLPQLKYNYIFVIDDNILAVSNQNIYRLPIKYRD